MAEEETEPSASPTLVPLRSTKVIFLALNQKVSMILRVTNKAAKKLKCIPLEALPKAPNQLDDWTVHVFTNQRRQYLFFTNSHSLLSIVIPGRDIKSIPGLLQTARQSLERYFRYRGVIDVHEHIFSSSDDSISICKVGDRSLQGSMNDMIYHACCHMLDGLDDLDEIAKRINDMPMLSLPGYFPHRVHISSGRTIVE